MKTKTEKMKSNLMDIRQQIDEVDQEMIYLISKRCRLSRDVGKVKNAGGMQIIDSERESLLFGNLRKIAIKHSLNWLFVQNLWRLILDESYRLQKNDNE